MTAPLSRAVMRLAVRCLGRGRHDWAAAMQAEFETAVEDGEPLTFAVGCLVGALREMPVHEEGRFVLASHVLAIGLILPVTTMSLFSIIGELGQSGAHDLLSIGGRAVLNEGNGSAVPSLAVILLLLAAGHLHIAWNVLEREWARVAKTGTMIAATAVTLALFSGLVFDSATGLIHAALAAIELGAVLVLAQWHAQLSPAAV